VGWPSDRQFGVASIGGGWTTPNGRCGGFGHPQTAGLGWPWPLGVVRPSLMAKSKKKGFVWPLGVAEPPYWALGWLRPPQTSNRPVWGGRSHPHGSPFYFLFYFIFKIWLLRVVGPSPRATPQLGWSGGGQLPHYFLI
jgi:hypothetical protein